MSDALKLPAPTFAFSVYRFIPPASMQPAVVADNYTAFAHPVYFGYILVTASAALASGKYTPQSTLPNVAAYQLPGSTAVVHNDTGGGGDPYNRLMMSSFSTTTTAYNEIKTLYTLRHSNPASRMSATFCGCTLPA